MTLLTLASLTKMVPGYEIIKQGAQIVGVLGQVLCFIIGLFLFGHVPEFELLTEDEVRFELWIVVESFVVVAIVFGNILYLFVRALRRDPYDIKYDTSDEYTDFLASEN